MADNLNYFWFLIAMIFSSFIEARPVSYPGGITLMQMNDTNKNSFHLHYSPTAKVSFGYKFEYWREKEFSINALQMNNLLKRWNKKNSQANIYFDIEVFRFRTNFYRSHCTIFVPKYHVFSRS